MNRSQYLARALDQMGQQPIQSAPQLGMDLASAYLLKQAQNRQQQGLAQNGAYNQAANSANAQATAQGMPAVIPWNNLPTSQPNANWLQNLFGGGG